MDTRWQQKLAALWHSCLLAAPDLWCEAPEELGARRALDIPLHPSRLARHGARLLVLVQLGYALHLMARQQWWVGMLAAGLCGCAVLMLIRRTAIRSARRLILTGDGRVHLLHVDGRLQQVWLHPASMQLGPWLLLVFRGRGSKPLFMGPDNLETAQLAALRRRLLY